MPGAPATTDVDSTREHRAIVPTRPYLFVVLHCERPLAGSSRHDLADLDGVIIGRGGERTAERAPAGDRRQLALRFPGNTVSSRHARLERVAASWVLIDDGSKNGTFVNGERIAQAALRDGDLVEIGSTLLVFRAALPPATDERLDLDTTALATTSPGLVTLIPQLAEPLASLARIAPLPIPILLLGESGSGKEVLAHAVHTLSGRPGAFVAVNCGGIPATLLESQLFGHVKGAFTGAARAELGFVRTADHGTLFLDEIGDLPATAQAALLRVLQEREVVPVGDARPVKVDLRVVAATHRPLDKMTTTGEFRADLLARLAGYRHVLAPLRARREDLGILVGDLLRRAELPATGDLRLTAAAGRRLFAHAWPLNIRELQQRLTVAAALAPRGVIDADHLSITPDDETTAEDVVDATVDPATLRETLVASLAHHRGNISHVARDLGKARMQIHRWMKRFGLDPHSFRD
jgi:DNA-binding NtrC family response regulator